MSENLVEVKHLQQYFPAGGMGKNKQYVQAVDDVSFAIRKGETLGLVGESGCGKTTTGRTLLRLYEPTDGTIIYDGKVLFDKKEKIAVDMLPYRRRMQIVFQDPYASLDPRMTIASASPAPWLWTPSSSSATSRSPRWTFRSRRRSSTCLRTCSRRWG